MHRLNLDPPTALRKRFPDQTRIVTVANDELVTILDVSILKWDLADCTFEDIGVPALALLLEALLGGLLMRLELHSVELVGEMLRYLVLKLHQLKRISDTIHVCLLHL